MSEGSDTLEIESGPKNGDNTTTFKWKRSPRSADKHVQDLLRKAKTWRVGQENKKAVSSTRITPETTISNLLKARP